MIRNSLIAASLTIALITGVPAFAQTAAPSPSPAPLAGFSGRGTLSFEITLPKFPSPLGMNAELAVMAKAHRVRVDLLKFASTTPDKNSSDMISHFLPTGAITVVYNQDTRAFVMWSDQKHEYYQSHRMAMPTAKQKPKTASAKASPLDQVMKTLLSITEYDSFTESLSLVGHQPINGHIASLYHMTLQTQKHGGKPVDITTDTAFADDLSGIPVRMWLTSKGEYDGAIKLDLLSASTDVPTMTVFNVPTGYKKVSSMMELFAKVP